ncbi:hypothetical protein ABHW69_03055 [Alicyclobacillus fastidiosus]|nr:hypothetical protein [Alicyclobacillus fastidiosus]WEH08823.1 hypothetical protein PYS47_19345 [Alicyclobacillus fastidiosus]
MASLQAAIRMPAVNGDSDSRRLLSEQPPAQMDRYQIHPAIAPRRNTN